jgi:hypothetical protein
MPPLADLVQWVLMGGVGVVFATIISAIADRRKNSASVEEIRSNAAKTMTDAATALVEPLTKRIERLERRDTKMTRLIEVHGRWDRLVAAELRKRSVRVPDPPPLYIDEDEDDAEGFRNGEVARPPR